MGVYTRKRNKYNNNIYVGGARGETSGGAAWEHTGKGGPAKCMEAGDERSNTSNPCALIEKNPGLQMDRF